MPWLIPDAHAQAVEAAQEAGRKYISVASKILDGVA